MNFSNYAYGLTGDNGPEEEPEQARYYLAYGSNLNKQQMSWRCPDAEPVGKTVLPGYRLEFRRGVLTIERNKKGLVYVGVWKISETDEKALDRYEGYPRLYRKKNFRVMVGGDEINAMAYIMTDGHPIEPPTSNY